MSGMKEKSVQISISEEIVKTEQKEQSGSIEHLEKKETFEQAVTDLEEIVNKLEKGELTLDESIQCFQRGVELTKYCSKKLDEAERSITMLIEGEDGIVEKEMPV